SVSSNRLSCSRDRTLLTTMRKMTAYVNASDREAHVPCEYRLRGRQWLVYATPGASLPSTDRSLRPCSWEGRAGPGSGCVAMGCWDTACRDTRGRGACSGQPASVFW